MAEDVDYLGMAMNTAKKLHEEKKKKAETAAREADIEASNRAFRQKQINAALKAFNGVQGISKQGNCLFKNNERIAEIEQRYETWENPNLDYRETESGVVICWTVYTKGNCTKVFMSGGDLDSFAEYMALAGHVTAE